MHAKTQVGVSALRRRTMHPDRSRHRVIDIQRMQQLDHRNLSLTTVVAVTGVTTLRLVQRSGASKRTRACKPRCVETRSPSGFALSRPSRTPKVDNRTEAQGRREAATQRSSRASRRERKSWRRIGGCLASSLMPLPATQASAMSSLRQQGSWSAPPPVASAPAPESETGLAVDAQGDHRWILPRVTACRCPTKARSRPPRPVGEFQQNSM